MEMASHIGDTYLDIPITEDQVFGRPDEHSDGLGGLDMEFGLPIGGQIFDIPITEDPYSYLFYPRMPAARYVQVRASVRVFSERVMDWSISIHMHEARVWGLWWIASIEIELVELLSLIGKMFCSGDVWQRTRVLSCFEVGRTQPAGSNL
jgi:hypothetical protein